MLQTITTLDETTPAALRPVLQPLPPLTEAGTRLLEAASDCSTTAACEPSAWT